MADYPDWTDSVAIIAAEIMLPMDLQAAYIMMPVDIQAQYLTLNIDIVAQSVGDISVDIAAASIGNIGIDIKAATIGNLNIDIEAQSIGMYLQPDWQVKAGTDKNLSGTATVTGPSTAYVLDYTVTNGKTFHICQWGFLLEFNGAIMAMLYSLHTSTYTLLAVNGGTAGGSQSFTKPITVVAGDHIKVKVVNLDGTDHTGYGSVGGFEI
jgi:hypothetical protein